MKLNSIVVKVNSSLIRQYNLVYATTNSSLSTDYGGIYYSGQCALTSVTQVGANGTSQLPATTFSYGQLQTYRQGSESNYTGNPGNPASFNWSHLTSINSGYGGTISFYYTQISNISAVNSWTREAVTRKIIYSGIGGYQNIPEFVENSFI